SRGDGTTVGALRAKGASTVAAPVRQSERQDGMREKVTIHRQTGEIRRRLTLEPILVREAVRDQLSLAKVMRVGDLFDRSETKGVFERPEEWNLAVALHHDVEVVREERHERGRNLGLREAIAAEGQHRSRCPLAQRRGETQR